MNRYPATMRTLPRHIVLPLAALVLGLLLIVGGLGARYATERHAPGGVGGPFALTDTNGKTVTDADFRGQPMLVFFGYTHCPDVCPTTLSSISQMLAALGPDKKAKALFITLDPERDTPAVLKDYLSSFDPRIVGLTGNRADIDKVEREYRVFAKKVPGQGGDYSMDHTAVVYLMDRDGNFVQSFNPDLDKPAEAAATFAKYL